MKASQRGDICKLEKKRKEKKKLRGNALAYFYTLTHLGKFFYKTLYMLGPVSLTLRKEFHFD